MIKQLISSILIYNVKLFFLLKYYILRSSASANSILSILSHAFDA